MNLTKETAVPGQKVTCIDAGSRAELTNGQDYTIYAAFFHNQTVSLSEVGGGLKLFSIGRFELATSKKTDTNKTVNTTKQTTSTRSTRSTRTTTRSTPRRHNVRDTLGRFTARKVVKPVATKRTTSKKAPETLILRPGALYAVQRKRRVAIARLRTLKAIDGEFYTFTEHGKPFFARKSQISFASAAEVMAYLDESTTNS